MDASASQDGQKIQDLAKDLAQLEKVNEDLFDELDAQSHALNLLEADFDQQLDALEKDE